MDVESTIRRAVASHQSKPRAHLAAESPPETALSDESANALPMAACAAVQHWAARDPTRKAVVFAQQSVPTARQRRLHLALNAGLALLAIIVELVLIFLQRMHTPLRVSPKVVLRGATSSAPATCHLYLRPHLRPVRC